MEKVTQYKIILLGSEGCGKTSIVQQLVNKLFYQEYVPTIGQEFHNKSIDVAPSIEAFLQIWDIGGESCFNKHMMESYILDAQAIIFVYDVTNLESFSKLNDLINSAIECSKKLKQKQPLIVIMSTKSDLTHLAKVKLEQHNTLCEKYNAVGYAVSSLNGSQIAPSFKDICCFLCQLKTQKQSEANKSEIIVKTFKNEPVKDNNESKQNINNEFGGIKKSKNCEIFQKKNIQRIINLRAKQRSSAFAKC